MSYLRSFVLILLCVYQLNIFAAEQQVMPMVSSTWLAENIDNVVVLDIRTSKKSFVQPAVFKAKGKPSLIKVGGHIPNSQLIVYSSIRGDRVIDGKTIKHMVVTAGEFEKVMQKAGVNQDNHIIVTTNAESGFDLTMATRMIWQLKHFGHNNVSLLNGGTAQWIIEGHEVVTSLDVTDPGNWQANQSATIFADSNDTFAATETDTIQLVDVRPLGQYLGVYKSGKAKSKGHIPTAKVFPVDLLSSRSTPVKFLTQSELKQLAAALNINVKLPIITYCNSGHMASGAWFVFHELLGNTNTRLYDGSMHQWTHEDRPVVSMMLE